MYCYYLNMNKQATSSGGNYELHKDNCIYCNPYSPLFELIGYYVDDKTALQAAKQQFPEIANKIDGCYFCCKSIHKN